MSNLADIKRRIASVKQTRQITGAMETVSVAKMRKALDKFEKNRAFTSALYDIVNELALSCEGDELLFNAPKVGKNLLIVLSTDRGLCGGFDHDIFKAAKPYIDDSTTVMPIGRTACEFYKNAKNTDFSFGGMYKADSAVARGIADELLKRYGKEVDRVSVAYSEFTSRNGYNATVKQILPFEKVESKNSAIAELPDPKIFKKIIPLYLSTAVFDAILNNTVAEHSARHNAMSAATESADGIIASLSVEYNRARQSKVTEQIVEIIGSVAALEGKGSLK